jgi:hypothetical protein
VRWTIAFSFSCFVRNGREGNLCRSGEFLLSLKSDDRERLFNTALVGDLKDCRNDVCTIEQPSSRGSHQSDLSSKCGSFNGECPPDEVVMAMEFSRCRIVATEMDDPRGAGVLSGVAIDAEDARCRSLTDSQVLEVEDARCNQVAIRMEDPRCQSLYMKW